MTDRRQFLAATGSLVAAFVASTPRSAALAAAPAADDAGARLNALFDVFMDERLSRNPDQLDLAGLDNGGSPRRSESHAGVARAPAAVRAGRCHAAAAVEGFRSRLVQRARPCPCGTVAYQMETIAWRTCRLSTTVTCAGCIVLVVADSFSAYQGASSSFLEPEHPDRQPEDAEAYLAPLAPLSHAYSTSRTTVQHDADFKVTPPDFLIDRTLEQECRRCAARRRSLDACDLARHAHTEDCRSPGTTARRRRASCQSSLSGAWIAGARPCASCGRARCTMPASPDCPGRGALRGGAARVDATT